MKTTKVLRAPLVFAWTALLSIPSIFAQNPAPRYTVKDLGLSLVRPLPETPGLNGHGDVALWHSISASRMPGLLLHGSQQITIEGDKDFSLVYPADVNDGLTVVGTLQAPQDLRFTHAFRWSDNHLKILASLGGAYAKATAINSRGEVVGSAQTAGGIRHGVLWREKKPSDLGLLAQGDYSAARDINDQGDVVGEANVVPNGKPQAFFWHAGKMQELPDLPGGTVCGAQAINNVGAIAGSCELPNGAAHGVVWSHGSVQDLGTLGDRYAPSTALDINSLGQVVGSSEDDGKLRAFLWQQGKLIDLNDAIARKSGWTLLVASRINEHGQIVGRGYLHGYIHAFLLEPVQTPLETGK